MKRLFTAHVQLVYEDQHGEANVKFVCSRPQRILVEPASAPMSLSLWESKIELGEAFFNEIIRHPVPLDMNTRCTALKRSPLGLDLYLWAVTYRTFYASLLRCGLTWQTMLYRQFGVAAEPKPDDNVTGQAVPPRLSPRAQEDQDWPGRDWSTASNEVNGTKSPAPWFCFRLAPVVPQSLTSEQLDHPNSAS